MNLKDCYNFQDFRKLAKKKLPSPIFHYIDGGSDDEITLRRNTKSFTEEKVKKSDIELILESGVWAPNHRNTEPWRFVVIDKSSELKKEISKSMISLQEESSNTKLSDDQKTNISLSVAKSPCFIFVFTTIGDTPEITEENYGAVCCAIQNMQLISKHLLKNI